MRRIDSGENAEKMRKKCGDMDNAENLSAFVLYIFNIWQSPHIWSFAESARLADF